MSPETISSIGTILAIAVLYVAKELWANYKKKEAERGKPIKFLKSISIGVEINKCLAELRVLTGANSVHILGYHNGTIGYNNVCFQYISMQYEATDSITLPHINNYQNIPAGQFSELMQEIHIKGFVYIDHNDNTTIGRLHRSYNVYSSYKFRIGNSIANGSVSISYYNREHKLTEKQKNIALDYVSKIESLISRK